MARGNFTAKHIITIGSKAKERPTIERVKSAFPPDWQVYDLKDSPSPLIKKDAFLVGNANSRADFDTSIEFSPSNGEVSIHSSYIVKEVSFHPEDTWMENSTTQILVGNKRRGRQEIPTAFVERVTSEKIGLRRAIIEVNLVSGAIRQEASLRRGRKNFPSAL